MKTSPFYQTEADAAAAKKMMLAFMTTFEIMFLIMSAIDKIALPWFQMTTFFWLGVGFYRSCKMLRAGMKTIYPSVRAFTEIILGLVGAYLFGITICGVEKFSLAIVQHLELLIGIVFQQAP